MAIAALILSHHLISVRAINMGSQDEELINISGRQRMLSQRILLFAGQFAETGQAQDAQKLEHAVDLFENAHERLLGAFGGNDRLRFIYRPGEPIGLDAMSRIFVRDARAVLASGADRETAQRHASALKLLGADTLLETLDNAVTGFEMRANDRTKRLKQIQLVAFVSSLLVILAELLLIFLPLHRWIMRTIGRLNREANHDALTGLLNRKRFAELMQEMFAKQGPDSTLAVVAMDLDGFKAVNDALGHPAGDELLQRVADMLRAQARCLNAVEPPFLARMGGDEFMMACLLPAQEAFSAVEGFGGCMLDNLEQPIALHASDSGASCLVGMSMGVSFSDDAGGSVGRLLSDADIALYTSKERGKGRLTRFHAALRATAEQRLQLETDLRRAAINGEFHPFFQPQVDLKTGRFVGFEVLARWKHPTRGLLGPDQFAEDAEKIGVLDMIEASLILLALEAMKGLRDDGFGVPRVFLNVSAQTLRDAEFVENLLSTVSMFCLPTSSIGIEISETVVIEGIDDPAYRSIQRLSQSGFATVLDDFGTGFASLSGLSGLDLHSVKMDQSLVAQISDPRMSKALRASVAMGKSMGLSVCAEGIETSETLDVLRMMGCDQGQGPVIGPLVDITGARDWLSHRPAGHDVVPFQQTSRS